jgi:para-aminobenzoate synthetase / 4-amino-4-deoxychorismate lyase
MPPRRQPDPRRGVFETLLVVAGEPVELDAHLARLAASVERLFGAELPADASDRALAAAAGQVLGRLRLSAAPRLGGEPGEPRRTGSVRRGSPGSQPDRALELEVTTSAVDPEIVFPELTMGACLEAVDRPGGLGAHKWVERVGLDRPDEGSGKLIADGGELLEAGWANLFVAGNGRLRTPPTDGRVLPGIARAAVLALTPCLGIEAREEPLNRADLLTADEVFLTNSIRGIEAAVELDGAPLPGAGPLSRRLAAALRRRWGLGSERDAPATPAAAPLPGPPAR